MKPLLLMIASVVCLSACAPDNGNDGAGDPPASEKPAPVPRRADPKWGELRCQKAKNCQDPVLNVSADTIALFMTRTAPQEDKSVPTAFLCGRALAEAWSTVTGTPGYGAGLDDFFLLMIEPATCLPYADWNLKLEKYFKNHGELKNEIR